MSSTRIHGVIGRLRQAAMALPPSDGQLLDAFIKERDQAAFEKLLRRHGAMVLGVCRRVAGADEADDAFQATFLALVRKAASIVPREAVGNWLYGVAYRSAMRARAEALRRRAKEKQVSDMPHPVLNGETGANTWTELEQALDRELSRLPDKHRLPIVLCDLEGRTRREVARQLGIPDGTLSNRLAAGRQLLAKRLAKLGFPVAGGAVGTWLAEHAAAASVPAPLLSAALGVAATGGGAAKVAALASGVIKGMLLTKLKKVTACLVLCALVGVGGTAYRAAATEQPGVNEPVLAQAGRAEEAQKRAELQREAAKQAAKDAAKQAAEAKEWSELFEREMTFFDQDKKTNYLDLDTGDYVEPGTRGRSVDLSGGLALSDRRTRIATYMSVAPIAHDAHPLPSAADIVSMLAKTAAKTSQIVGGRDESYLFKTAAGNIGLMDITPINQAQGVVRVRWRLLRRDAVPDKKWPVQLDLDRLLLGSWIGRGGLVPSALTLNRDKTFLLGIPGNFAAETGDWDLDTTQLPFILTLHIKKSDGPERVDRKLRWEVRELNEKTLTVEDRANLRSIGYQRPTEKGLAPEDDAQARSELPQGLEFLRPIREFHAFRFGQDEAAIRRIAKEQSLTVTGTAATGFTVTRADGETLALSMRDGVCSGIQRLGKK
jgi:RNA polymerase sigma factor (sigma-70 family)